MTEKKTISLDKKRMAKLRKAERKIKGLIKQEILNSIEHPKQRASVAEMINLIDMVLNTGNSETKVLKKFMIDSNKSMEWKKDVSGIKPGNGFMVALDNFKGHEIALTMRNNNILNIEKDKVFKGKTLTGSLAELSKYVKINALVTALKKENFELKASLKTMNSGQDRKEYVRSLWLQKIKPKEIIDRTGIPSSTVYGWIKEFEQYNISNNAEFSEFCPISEKRTRNATEGRPA